MMEVVVHLAVGLLALIALAGMVWSLVERDRMAREVQEARVERSDAVNGNINIYQSLEECRARCRALSLALACAVDDFELVLRRVRASAREQAVIDDAVDEVALHVPGGLVGRPLGAVALGDRVFAAERRQAAQLREVAKRLGVEDSLSIADCNVVLHQVESLIANQAFAPEAKRENGASR